MKLYKYINDQEIPVGEVAMDEETISDMWLGKTYVVSLAMSPNNEDYAVLVEEGTV